MRSGVKLSVALAFVGAVASAAAAFGQVGEVDPGAAAGEEKAPAGEQMHRRRGPAHMGRRLVHGEFTVQRKDGSFGLVIVDHGTVKDVDHGAKTLTLERADGATVTVTAGDETKIRRNREQAPFDAIQEGDHVRVVQAEKDDGTVVRLIAARAPGHKPSARGERPAGMPAPALFDA